MGLLSGDAHQQWPYILIELSGEGDEMIRARKVGDFKTRAEAQERSAHLNRVCPKITYLATTREQFAQWRTSGERER